MPFTKLDPQRIRDEALRLFRAEGLAGVGIRRLAASLNVQPSSLYWHVKDKNALHAMLSADIFRACVDAVPDAGSWDEWLRAFGLSLWDAQSSMPDTRTLIMLCPVPEAARQEQRRRIGALLERRGMRAALAGPAQYSVQALVTGWTTLDRTPQTSASADRAPFEEALDTLVAGWRGCVRADAAIT